MSPTLIIAVWFGLGGFVFGLAAGWLLTGNYRREALRQLNRAYIDGYAECERWKLLLKENTNE